MRTLLSIFLLLIVLIAPLLILALQSAGYLPSVIDVSSLSNYASSQVEYWFNLLESAMECLPFGSTILTLTPALLREQAASIDWLPEILRAMLMIPMYSFTWWILYTIFCTQGWAAQVLRQWSLLQSAVFYSANMTWAIVVTNFVAALQQRNQMTICIAATALVLLLWAGQQARLLLHGSATLLSAARQFISSLLGLAPLYVITALLRLLIDLYQPALIRMAACISLAALLFLYFKKKDSIIFSGVCCVLGVAVYTQWGYIAAWLTGIVL